jgi:hypothetical protein
MQSCPEFWLQKPYILVADATEFFPFTEHDRRCTASALNSFTRFGVYLGVLLAVVRFEATWLLTGIVFGLFAIIMWKYMEHLDTVREGFVDTDAPIAESPDVIDRYIPDIIGSSGRTEPTAANPFMNVLMTEYTDNPDRSVAENNQGVRVRNELDSYFQTMFHSDPGDAFQHTQSQRQFVTMPSTTIPNDQESYQNWLYRTPGQTCKEGNMAVCDFDTGDSAIPWREIRKST